MSLTENSFPPPEMLNEILRSAQIVSGGLYRSLTEEHWQAAEIVMWKSKSLIQWVGECNDWLYLLKRQNNTRNVERVIIRRDGRNLSCRMIHSILPLFSPVSPVHRKTAKLKNNSEL